jgi:hypothetical protein
MSLIAKEFALDIILTNHRYSVRRGVHRSSGEIIIMMDADLPVGIEQCDKLIEAISARADVAIGSRVLGKHLQNGESPIYRRICSSAFRSLVRLFLGLSFRDTQCGFKAFSRDAADVLFTMLTVEHWAFDVEVLLLADLLNYHVAEIDVQTSYHEGSKINLAGIPSTCLGISS